MDLNNRLKMSYYETVTAINEPHQVYLVRHRETGRIFVKKYYVSITPPSMKDSCKTRFPGPRGLSIMPKTTGSCF